MSPVASWAEAVDDLLDQGVQGLTSYRQLAARLSSLNGQPAENWRRRLRRYRAGTVPSEKAATLIAQAFAIPREQLPSSRRRSLSDRVAALELAMEGTRTEVARLAQRLEGMATVADMARGLHDIEARLAAIESSPAAGPGRRP